MKTDGRRGIAWLVILAVVVAAPFASAQTTKKKKKKPKPAATAPAQSAAPIELDSPPPASAEPTPPPPPAETATAPAEAPKEDAASKEKPMVPVEHNEGPERYVGLRYRGTIIPKFLVNLFADEGTGVYSNSIGVEYEIRHDGFSMIPWLAYAEYGFGDTLFLQSGQPATAQYYSDVNSSLKAVYAGLDLLWSTPISGEVDFEYGGGAGLGFIFGSIGNNWVQADPNGPLVSANGQHFSPCTTVVPGTGCDPKLHQNSSVDKVGGYTEKNWFGGGSVPVFFPTLTPELGIRWRPVPQVALRGTLGISLTGFFFGISGGYNIANL